MKNKTALLILNSPDFNSVAFMKMIDNSINRFYIVVVDGGMNHYLNLIEKGNTLPKIDLFVGDMDSVEKHRLDSDKHQLKIDKVKTLNKDKDYSDYHVTLSMITNVNISRIVVFAGIGGRVDHFISNYESSILFSSKYDFKISLIGEKENIYFRNRSFTLKDLEFDFGNEKEIKIGNRLISLFSGTEQVTNLSLSDGFKYRTSSYNLRRDDPIGLSNILLDDDNALISFDEFKDSKNENILERSVLVLIDNVKFK